MICSGHSHGPGKSRRMDREGINCREGRKGDISGPDNEKYQYRELGVRSVRGETIVTICVRLFGLEGRNHSGVFGWRE